MTATRLGKLDGSALANGIIEDTPEPSAGSPVVSDLMAGLCHDLRTPLNAIIGFSEIIERELLGPLGSERYQNYATYIRQSGIDLLAAVESTIALTQKLAEARVAAQRS